MKQQLIKNQTFLRQNRFISIEIKIMLVRLILVTLAAERYR